MTGAQNRDTIDQIGDALPENVRTAYYREMMYCRSLPENDELLRVLRAMQFLTLLMEGIPKRVVTERERMQILLTDCLKQFERLSRANEASQEKLQQKLVQLPGFIAAGISPETIVTEINSRLEKQFSSSTIPQLSERLVKTATKIDTAISTLDATVKRLGNTYDGTVEKARKTMEHVDETVCRAAETADRAARRLSAGFHQQYWWSVFLLTTIALFIGIIAGILLMTPARNGPAQKIEGNAPPVTQKVPQIGSHQKK
jgi:hypothetical protein